MSNFKVYLKELQKLKVEETLLKKDRSVLILSGSSHYQHASLTMMQKEFLQSFSNHGYHPVLSNFPYNENFPHQLNTFPGLLSASISNIRYYGHTEFNSFFQSELKRHLLPLFKLKETVVVTQSSGLNLLTQVLDEGLLTSELQVFALGPVSRRKVNHPQVNSYVIKGDKDIYSRWLDCNTPNAFITANHHNYLLKEQVKEIFYDQIIKNKN